MNFDEGRKPDAKALLLPCFRTRTLENFGGFRETG
jgi:hypothetical protein